MSNEPLSQAFQECPTEEVEEESVLIGMVKTVNFWTPYSDMPGVEKEDVTILKTAETPFSLS